jgi:TPR repeat protein
MKRYKLIFLIIVICVIPLFAQSQNKSEAFQKKGLFYKTPLLKPKYPSYNLAATYLLKEKARKGDPFAQHELGIRYILGVGIPKDSLKAAYWIKQAAAKKLPAANFNYAIMLSNGIGVEWNPFEAFKNFEISAESGMEQAQYIVGLNYVDNLIVSKDFKKAYYWLKKSSDKGFEEAKKVLIELSKNNKIAIDDSLTQENEYRNPKANLSSNIATIDNFELDFYDFQKDTLSNTDEKKYLSKIIRTNTSELKRILKIDSQNSYKMPKDTSANGLIDFAAQSGSPEALLLKGRFLENGIGIEKNEIEAASNFLKAFSFGSFKAAEYLLKLSREKKFYNNLETEIRHNNANAMYVWAGLVALGMDYTLTEKQAFELLVKARKQNHINSIIELGLAYYNGTLIEKDSIKAIEYLNEAAALGSSEAEVRLVFFKIKENPNMVLKSEINILQKYANQGSVLATAALAFCYENGLSVAKRKAKASKLYRKAAQRGNEAAYNSLRAMYDAIRPDEEKFKIYF